MKATATAGWLWIANKLVSTGCSGLEESGKWRKVDNEQSEAIVLGNAELGLEEGCLIAKTWPRIPQCSRAVKLKSRLVWVLEVEICTTRGCVKGNRKMIAVRWSWLNEIRSWTVDWLATRVKVTCQQGGSWIQENAEKECRAELNLLCSEDTQRWVLTSKSPISPVTGVDGPVSGPN